MLRIKQTLKLSASVEVVLEISDHDRKFTGIQQNKTAQNIQKRSVLFV